MIESILAILAGLFIGIITGLIPGIHVNLLAALIISFLPFLLSIFSPITLMIFIIALTITHIFLDYIPSYYLGCPDPSTILSIYPAHKLLQSGRGYEAIRLSAIGSLLGLLSIIILSPLVYYLAKYFYPIIKDYIAFILIAASLILIIREKSKFSALIIYLLVGLLGIIVLTMPNINQPLLPMLSGLFGISTLILSINNKTILPIQSTNYNKINKKETAKAISSSFIAALLTSFLPGMSSSESAILATSFFKRVKLRTYLILIGSINSIVILLSFIAIFAIGKARSGSASLISVIIQDLTLAHLVLIIIAIFLSSLPIFFITLFIARKFSRIINKVNYQKLCYIIIAFIILLVFFISSFQGLLILAVSASIGLLPSLLNIQRHHLMSCLILPVILFLLL